ncbi:MAG: hypothetical protein Q9202_001131 [Teloschistes flavicans]
MPDHLAATHPLSLFRPSTKPMGSITPPSPSFPPRPAKYNASLTHRTSSIHNPPRPSPTAPIILYFPSNLPSQNPREHDPLNTLSLSAHATIVHIAYRLSPEKPYPRPIHDVLAAYDWVRKHLVSVPQNNNGSPCHHNHHHHSQSKPVGVIGELDGASLAASLALTECHDRKAGAIKAAALGNAVVDWSSPFNNSKICEGSHHQVFARELLALRKKAFARTADRYDPFASPLLFFRTPAWELVPEPFLYGFPSSASASSSGSENDSKKIAGGAVSSAASKEGVGEELVPKRRSHRKYPPLGSGLRLPMTRIEVGETSTLREQGLEMAELMQRSVDIQAREEYPGFDVPSRGGPRTKRVEVVERQGGGMWGEKEMAEAGLWLGEALRSR